jgi:mannitol-1-/sugar-/sorbitol-6-phosphatase
MTACFVQIPRRVVRVRFPSPAPVSVLPAQVAYRPTAKTRTSPRSAGVGGAVGHLASNTFLSMQAFLFDIDGTLVDSSAVVERTWRQVASEFRADPAAILGSCHGRRDTEVVREFFPPEVTDRVLNRIAALEAGAVDGIVAVRGAPQLLGTLDPGQWAAVTSGSRALMQARLQAAGLPVPGVLIAAEDVRCGKPDPAGFLMAASALGVPPADCAVVEDSPAGIAAGRAAGAVVIGVTTTHSAEALSGADLVVTDLVELAHAMRRTGWAIPGEGHTRD